MKKLTILFTASCMVLGLLNAQEKKVEDAKTGWGFGVLPAVSFDTDLGFQYGGLVNFFDYGDGSAYPGYEHSIYMEVSRFTKGSGIYRFYYDSEYLIPGIQITTDLSYLPDEAYDFGGFNGAQALYQNNWVEDGASDYRTRMFYKMKNNIFRFKTDVQVPLSGKSFRAIAGFNLLNFNITEVDVDKLNKGKDDNLLPPHEGDAVGLYERYQNWGLISSEEADGGFVPIIKAGLVFDTRDNLPNPMKGIWTEAFLFGAPELLGAESSFLKLNITHRQYFTIIENDLSFAYRVSYQGTLSGKTPFYYQPQIETSVMKGARSEGLGGGRTLRGIRRNRVVGDGFVYGNAELRWKAVRFNFINQKWYLGINGFMDAGQVVQKIDVEDVLKANGFLQGSDNELAMSTQVASQYFDFENEEKLHLSYGAGLRVVMNQNFIISIDYGRAVDTQDGESGVYIGLNYLF